MSTKDAISPTSIRWPAELKAEIDRRAEAEARTFSSYVIHTVQTHIAKLQRDEAAKASKKK